MSNFQTRKYENPLDERTLEFGKKVIRLCKALPKNVVAIEPIKQVMRSGCSVGANYREANDALSKKDFAFRLRVKQKHLSIWHSIDGQVISILSGKRIFLQSPSTFFLDVHGRRSYIKEVKEWLADMDFVCIEGMTME